jgi:endonuclease/exonuclease/phosphatase family metal-dependent hydrolase
MIDRRTASAPPDRSTMRGRELRAATFNIRHGSRDDGTVDHHALIESCRALRADVLGMQEVDRGRRRSRFRDQSKLVARAVGCRSAYGSVLRRGAVGHYGNALVARGHLHDLQYAQLPRPTERQPRGAILATVDIDGRMLSVAVTHLQHHPAHLRHLPAEAPTQLRALLSEFDTWPTPKILLGDLNLGPVNATPMLTAAGYEVAPNAPTFPSQEPRITLDYVAVKGADIVEAEVVAASVSDHRAVVVTLRFP